MAVGSTGGETVCKYIYVLSTAAASGRSSSAVTPSEKKFNLTLIGSPLRAFQ